MLRTITLALLTGLMLSAGFFVDNAQATEISSADTELASGRKALLDDDPTAALRHYQMALSLVPEQDRATRRAALLGVGRAAFWLEQYPLAEQAYRQALALTDTTDDHTAISLKLARSLTLIDRPREAYTLAASAPPASFEAAVEKARAALLLGWETRAAEALSGHAVSNIPSSDSDWLSKEYRQQQEELDDRLRRSINVELGYTDSNDDERTRELDITANFQTLHLPGTAPGMISAFWGIGVNQQWIDDKQSSVQTTELSGSMATNLSDNIKLNARLGVGQQSEWQYGVGTLGVSYRPNDTWGTEAGLESGAVKTTLALKEHTTYDALSVGADHRFGNSFILAGALFQQGFSDGNDRNGIIVRANMMPLALPAIDTTLDIQLYERRYHDSDTNTQGYFNPEDFHEEQMRFYFTRRVSTDWKARVMLAPGRQTVDGDSSGTLFGELLLRGKISRDLLCQVKAGVDSTDAVSSTADSYREKYVYASVAIPW